MKWDYGLVILLEYVSNLFLAYQFMILARLNILIDVKRQ